MLDAPDSEPQNALRDAVAAHVQSHPTKLPPLVPPPIPEGGWAFDRGRKITTIICTNINCRRVKMSTCKETACIKFI